MTHVPHSARLRCPGTGKAKCTRRGRVWRRTSAKYGEERRWGQRLVEVLLEMDCWSVWHFWGELASASGGFYAYRKEQEPIFTCQSCFCITVYTKKGSRNSVNTVCLKGTYCRLVPVVTAFTFRHEVTRKDQMAKVRPWKLEQERAGANRGTQFEGTEIHRKFAIIGLLYFLLMVGSVRVQFTTAGFASKISTRDSTCDCDCDCNSPGYAPIMEALFSARAKRPSPD